MNKISKTIFGAASAIVAVASATAPLAEVSARGDNSTNGRTAYTMKSIEKANLGTTPVFNSITDNSTFGNEFDFVGARAEGATSIEPSEITIEDGKTYVIRLYFHNDNKNSTATGVKAYFNIPAMAAKNITVKGYLTADNSNPTEYWDDVVFKSNEEFYLEYVPGSAVLQNNGIGATNEGVAISSDVLVKDKGALLGDDKLDGEVSGCYNYDGSVLVKVVAKKANYTIEKTVRKAGTNDAFTESIDAKVGDKVEFKIHFKNNSASKIVDPKLKDVLPENLTNVKDLKLVASNGKEYSLDGSLADGIYVSSSVKAGSEFDIYFTADVSGTAACGSSTTRTNTASMTIGSNAAYTVSDTASVVVKGETCAEESKEDPKDDSKDNTEDNKNKPTTETTDEVADTGAGEIFSAVLGAGSLTTALGYYIASRKKM